MPPGLVRVGRIGRPHGVRGEVTVVPETDEQSRFSPGSRLVSAEGVEFVVTGAHPYRDRGLIVAFAGFSDRNRAETLRGTVLFGEAADRRPLAVGEFWAEELTGLVAVDPAGGVLGTVSGVDFGVAQDRLIVVTPTGGTVLVPFVSALVGDPAGGRIEIRDPGGLF